MSKTLIDRLRALAESERPTGPRIEEVSADVDNLLSEYLEAAVEAAQELRSAADNYASAEDYDKADQAEARQEARDEAKEKAEALADALDQIMGVLQ